MAVAEVTGAVPHPLMQWHRLIGAADPYAANSALWSGASPALGHLDSDAFQRLAAVLASHTPAADDSICGYWTGYPRATVVTLTALWTGQTGSAALEPTAPSAPPSAQAAPLHAPPRDPEAPDPLGVVHHTGRDYELFTGSVEAMTGNSWSRQSPHLLWPADQTWCVATEVDFDSTLVAGDHALIHDLLTTPGLDVWPVQPTDLLGHDADLITDH